MTRYSFIQFFLALFISTPAMAAPTYLDCFITLDEKPFKFNVTADESSGTITHTNNDGSAFKASAAYTASSVTYQKIEFLLSGKVKSEMVYEINRETLDVARSHSLIMLPEDPRTAPHIAISKGKCQVQEVKMRKF